MALILSPFALGLGDQPDRIDGFIRHVIPRRPQPVNVTIEAMRSLAKTGQLDEELLERFRAATKESWQIVDSVEAFLEESGIPLLLEKMAAVPENAPLPQALRANRQIFNPSEAEHQINKNPPTARNALVLVRVAHSL